MRASQRDHQPCRVRACQAAPQLRAYPKYTVIAEKLHGICLLGIANTRMKDLRVLLGEHDLDATLLVTAVNATFVRRGFDAPTAPPAGLTDQFAGDATKQRQWAAFLKKSRLEAPDLSETTQNIREALAKHGVLQA